MAGVYRSLVPGHYRLDVSAGEGPAGVRRPGGEHVDIGVDGGHSDFHIAAPERVFFWWRGPEVRPGVTLVRRDVDVEPRVRTPMPETAPVRRRRSSRHPSRFPSG